MKISCEIIKDLLPLYHDSICSEETKIMVEEHLNFCDNCKAELQAIEDSLSINHPEQNLNEAEAVQRLSKRWKKGMMKSLFKGIFFTVLVIIVVFFVLYMFIDFKIVPKSY